ncbi:MAG: class III extradiol ring-cleavage dioxygenase [Rhizomicrobium sp.]
MPRSTARSTISTASRRRSTRLAYPAPGDAALSARVAALLDAGIDDDRGLDHGAWVPLLLMYPQADIPVVQIAVQPHRGVAHHIALGRALAPLRDEGVLVIGSGTFVHNLRLLDRRGVNAPEPEWSKLFANWMDDALRARDDAALIDYRARAPYAAQAHPEEEHLLPLFVAYGAAARRSASMPARPSARCAWTPIPSLKVCTQSKCEKSRRGRV